MKTIVVLGLSLSSSWGNGHATTFRALLRGLAGLAAPEPSAGPGTAGVGTAGVGTAAPGHRVLFLERDVPWYAEHRDLPEPDFCELAFYASPDELRGRFARALADADAVIVGSYVPDGIAALDTVLALARGAVAFYDIDTPVTLAALARGDCAYLAPRQIPRLRPVPVLHRRPDAGAADGAARRPDAARAVLRRRPRRATRPRPSSRTGTSATSAPTARTGSRRWSGC